jgi:hypothetical protein
MKTRFMGGRSRLRARKVSSSSSSSSSSKMENSSQQNRKSILLLKHPSIHPSIHVNESARTHLPSFQGPRITQKKERVCPLPRKKKKKKAHNCGFGLEESVD